MATETQALRALDAHEETLGRCKNVVGMGVVPADEAGGKQMAVGVYVKKKLPLDRLAEKDVVPTTLEVMVGNRVVTVPTRVIEQGTVKKEEVERLER